MNDPPDVLYDVTVLGLELLLVLLSTQLYANQNPESPPTNQETNHVFLSCFMSKSTPVLAIVQHILDWFINRLHPPPQSLAAHHTHLLHTIVSSQFLKKFDGYSDRSDIVQAFCPSNANYQPTQDEILKHQLYPPQSILLDATRGVIQVSSKILVLPFRILFLVLFFWNPSQSNNLQLTQDNEYPNNTPQKFLWISYSPICDLGVSLLLLVTQNYCQQQHQNHYRDLLHESEMSRTLIKTTYT